MSILNPKKSSQKTDSNFSYIEDGRIYLDSACQTLRPKPVIDAMNEYFATYNACGGRTKYEWGQKVDTRIESTRTKTLKLLSKSPKNYTCSFTLNTTYGINLILSQLPESRFSSVITTNIEHNSVFLPTISVAKKLRLNRVVLNRDNGVLNYNIKSLKNAVVILNTTSNITGENLTNLKELEKDIHKQNGILIIDAAQTMGHEPEILKDINFDALCFSAHKMYGPSLGVVVIKNDLLNNLDINFVGGGLVSNVKESSYTLLENDLSSRLEAGLQNYSGIIGFEAAINWFNESSSLRKNEIVLANKLNQFLSQKDSITLLSPENSSIQTFFSKKIDSHKLAIALSSQNIMARSGYFCCHYFLTEQNNYPPLLRISIGMNNTKEQIDKLIETIKGVI